MKNKPKTIYLDYASSAPMDARVFQAMKKYMLEINSNPGSLHKSGIQAKSAVQSSRKIISKILNCRQDEIIFTGSGTESNNLAILGIISEYISKSTNISLLGNFSARPSRPVQGFSKHILSKIPHVVTTNIEHPSVLEVCKFLEKNKLAKVTYVPVEENGIVDPKKIKEAIKTNTVLISVCYANNEIGSIQPITEIAKEIRNYRKNKAGKRSGLKNLKRPDLEEAFPFFHTDACQAMNYLPIRVDRLGVDLMTFNGSKIYGPKGMGVLFKKRNVRLSPLMHGGDQEFDLRPGTENVSGIVGTATALSIAEAMKDKETKRLTKLRDYFISLIRANKGIVLNGDEINRLPNNVNISVPGIESDLLVIELDARRIEVSSKSACQSDDPEESYVIKALRPLSKIEEGSIRFSLGRETTKADIDYTLNSLGDILFKLKKEVYFEKAKF